MRIVFFFLALAFYISSVNAQEKKRFTIQPGEKAMEKIPATDLYRYPAFTSATVQFRDGRSVQARLNYNKLFGEMQFIHSNGDTLSLADEGMIKWITAGPDTFLFHEGWMEQIADCHSVKLARMTLIQVSNKEKIGGMGVPAFGAVETNTKSTMSQQTRDLVAKEQLTYTLYDYYFFADRFNSFFPATRKSLLKIYSEKEGAVSQYLKNAKPDFNREADLLELAIFLKRL